MEHIIAVLRPIPEITWHSGVGKLPSINVLYESTLSSFDFKKPRVLIQSFKDRALAATKATIHLKIQRKCLTGEGTAGRKDVEKLDEGSRLASPATFIPAEEGDLESALGVLDYIEGRADFVRWGLTNSPRLVINGWHTSCCTGAGMRGGLSWESTGCCRSSSSTRSIPNVTPLGR